MSTKNLEEQMLLKRARRIKEEMCVNVPSVGSKEERKRAMKAQHAEMVRRLNEQEAIVRVEEFHN
ncbi:TPA: hypothetical protein ACOEF8_003528 [Enterobacter roggenkampii]